MILFVFEGEKQEPEIYKTIEKLFFSSESDERIYFSYCCNIYKFYKKIKNEGLLENDEANLPLLLIKELKTHPELNPHITDLKADNISQIYLFFDYDIQESQGANGNDTTECNSKIQEMLSYFNDETTHGKLYINYPMVDSYRYTDKLPDKNYVNYEVALCDCGKFKEKLAKEKPFYRDYKRLQFRESVNEHINNDGVLCNWKFINQQNISKANFICNNSNSIPKRKSDVDQEKIFKNELQKYVHAKDSVAILNAFPLFLFEYFKDSSLFLPK